MKCILLLLLVGLIVSSPFKGSCQDVGGKTLISQSRVTSANIGNSDITITYHSPSVNGRRIFGGIVPFHFVVDGVEYPWRAGSNQRTKIEFTHDVMVEGSPLSAGTYGFVVLVEKDEWVLIFSSDMSWGAFNYDKSKDVLRVKVKPSKVPFQEWLSYEFINPNSQSVDIQLSWEETAFVFNVTTNSLVNKLANLNKKEKKSAADYQDLALLTIEQDPENVSNAMQYLEQSLGEIPKLENEKARAYYEFNYKIIKSGLLERQGQKEEAAKLVKSALENAAGFSIYYYALRLYTEDGEKEKALQVLNESVKRYPSNFQNHFALGEYYLKENNQRKATEHFKRAYDMTVEQKDGWENYARYLYLQNKLVLENSGQ